MNWIFLDNTEKSQYVELFAKSAGKLITPYENFVYADSNDPLVIRGILKNKLIKQCWKDNRTFYYFDTGYVGNDVYQSNPNGYKYWHRIVKNDLQHGKIIPRPDDRWRKLNKIIKPWKRSGSRIIIAAPDEKPCKFYGIELEQWLTNLVDELKKYTDRPIVVRKRPSNRIDRQQNIPLIQELENDAHALITFNSIAATEAIMNGIPAFTLAPTNAASPVSLQDISSIENPYYADPEKVYAWACHLAYGQFHTEELKNGTALNILYND